ncbi:MAG: tRNA pseudouridine(13) synthase TruD [Planctomycetes bacterium]|nr:tRNA pseudouridine(13) synthase TruD [Planctomycetota bacterium]
MKFITAEVPPCPGAMKSINEDFRVEEIPLYAFAGSGDHTLVQIEKSGISTFEAIKRLSGAVMYPERDVGLAGLKDARGITRQWLSFEHVAPEKFANLEVPKLRVLQTTRHANKLKRGHLKGNRFEVVLRGVAEADCQNAARTLDILKRRGVPNWYDSQRFGRRLDSARLGLALVKRDWKGYFDILLGEPDAKLEPRTAAARKAYEDGKFEDALKQWPGNANVERMALKAVMAEGAGERALRSVQHKLKLLHVSAAQSLLFNRCLERRLSRYDQVFKGDICQKQNGACFIVEDAAAEQPRVPTFEISPTGPIFGTKMLAPGGETAAMEAEVLAEAGLNGESFDIGHGLTQKGDRRPYRFPVGDLSMVFDRVDGTLTLRFALPKGCYATVLVREITKDADVDLTFGDE